MERILVGVDFSPDSGRALELAERIVDRRDGEIHLVHVVENRIASAVAAGIRDLRERLEGWTDALRERATSARAIVLRGEPAQVILDYAESEQSDLIVLGTHGHTAGSSLLLGSVADRVLRHAKAPVLVVRHPARTTLPLPGMREGQERNRRQDPERG